MSEREIPDKVQLDDGKVWGVLPEPIYYPLSNGRQMIVRRIYDPETNLVTFEMPEKVLLDIMQKHGRTGGSSSI